MKIISANFKTVAFAFLLSIGLGATACSNNTSEGKVSVEESDFKDKNPTEHNENANNTGMPSTDTTQQMGDAYEKVDGDKGVSDSDNDGKADQ